jgi:DNA adenine methylase
VITTPTSQLDLFTGKIGSLAPWFGAKRTLAHVIIEELGSHNAYWEPFCGSMAVLLAKPPAPMETVNDLHDDLINLSRVVAHREHGPALYRRLRRVPFSETEFVDAKARLVADKAPLQRANVGIHPARAADYFVISWMGMNGVAGVRSSSLNFARRFTKNGGAPAKRWRGAVETIPAFRRRLRGVAILSADGIELCSRIEDADGTVIYVDPPYIVKGAKYLHDFEASDHRRLAEVLNRFKRTRVVVSYYEHPDLAAIYPGWTVRRCPTTKAMVSTGQRDGGGVKAAPEVLIINGPSLAKGGVA